MLDGRSRITSIATVSIGGMHGASVRLSDVLRLALVAKASAFILAHNHPDVSRDDCVLRSAHAGAKRHHRFVDTTKHEQAPMPVRVWRVRSAFENAILQAKPRDVVSTASSEPRSFPRELQRWRSHRERLRLDLVAFTSEEDETELRQEVLARGRETTRQGIATRRSGASQEWRQDRRSTKQLGGHEPCPPRANAQCRRRQPQLEIGRRYSDLDCPQGGRVFISGDRQCRRCVGRVRSSTYQGSYGATK